MKTKLSTLLKCLVCGLLVLLTVDLQAQLIFKTKFSAVEGYTNGWVIGQPSQGNKWINCDADWDYLVTNNIPFGPGVSGGYSPMNNGCSWWPTTNDIPGWPGGPWYVATATNCTAPGGGQLRIASDNPGTAFGTNGDTYFFKMDFPTQRKGPITVTWDWQYFMTNEIPADYDVYTNNYPGLPGFDHGFTLSDYANCIADAGTYGNPNWKYSELSTPFRLGGLQDARHNIQGACGGGGDWNNYGPEFKDGKLLHMKLILYVTNSLPDTNGYDTVNTYDGFCQRDGETNWQTAFSVGGDVWDWQGVEHIIAQSGMRRCAGETDPTSGINCIMLWMNGSQFPRYVTVSNIRVVGPNPVPVPNLKAEKNGANVKMTFDGWLEAADVPQGPYTTVAVTSPYTVPAAAAAKKFYRANN